MISNVLVVGAGPAGLSSALALCRGGIDVEVLDLAPDRAVIGSELLVSGPALRALDSLGVAEEVARTGTPLTMARTHDPDGRLLAEIPFFPVAGSALPPAVGITRRGLHDALYDRAVSAGARIRHGLTVSGFAETGDGVVVTRSDGTVGDYDLVVGADGVQSRVRSLIMPDQRPEYTGEMVWRARVPRRAEATLEAYAGHRNHAGYLTVSADTAYVFCLVASERPDRVPAQGFPERLRADLAGFPGTVGWARDRLGGPESIHYAPIMALLLPDPWYTGRAVLIGDAAHATPPHIGYGAGLAIEDGLVLAESLLSAATVDEGFKTFMARRYERCALVVRSALTLCGWQLRADPEADPDGTLMRTWQALSQPI